MITCNAFSNIPKLELLRMNKIIDAKTIWNGLSDFLSAKKQEIEKSVPIGDDNLSIEAYGFDLKTSCINNYFISKMLYFCCKMETK